MEYKKELSLLLFFIGIAFTRGGTESPRDVSPDTLIFGTIISEPYMMQVGEIEGEPQFEGFLVDLWQEMDKVMDGKYSKYMFSLAKDGKYGRLTVNGTWNGMIGELVDGEVDVIFAPLTVSANRMKVVDFTEPFLQPSLAVALRKDIDIKSARQLIKSDLSYGTVSSGSTILAMQNSSAKVIQQLYQGMIEQTPSPFVNSNEEGVKRALSEDYAYIGASDALEYLASRNCDLTTFNIREFSNYAFAFEKGSRYTEEFNAALAEVMLKGTVDELFKKWWKDSCDEMEETAAVADVGMMMPTVEMSTESGMSTDMPMMTNDTDMTMMKNESVSGSGVESESPESGMGEEGMRDKMEAADGSGDDTDGATRVSALSVMVMSFFVGIVAYLF